MVVVFMRHTDRVNLSNINANLGQTSRGFLTAQSSINEKTDIRALKINAVGGATAGQNAELDAHGPFVHYPAARHNHNSRTGQVFLEI